MTVEEKLAFFSRIAIQEAKQEQANITADIDQRMNELVLSVTQDAQKQAGVRLLKESSKIEQNKNKEINSAAAESKKTIIKVRGSLIDALFEEAANEIRKFTQTDDYKKRLIEDICELAGKFSHVKVYLMDRDLQVSEKLTENCECINVKDDFIGGFKILIPERNALMDQTYISRLKDSRADFNALKIN